MPDRRRLSVTRDIHVVSDTGRKRPAGRKRPQPAREQRMSQEHARTEGQGKATHVGLDLEHDYRFRVDFGAHHEPLVMDEPPPLGNNDGPNASAVLAAAVGNCLSASLLYCLRKARIEVDGMHTDVRVSLARNEAGRLRVSAIRVELQPRVTDETSGRVERCRQLFEDFCVVTESVRTGIDVEVIVSPESAAPPVAEPHP